MSRGFECTPSRSADEIADAFTMIMNSQETIMEIVDNLSRGYLPRKDVEVKRTSISYWMMIFEALYNKAYKTNEYKTYVPFFAGHKDILSPSVSLVFYLASSAFDDHYLMTLHVFSRLDLNSSLASRLTIMGRLGGKTGDEKARLFLDSLIGG